MNDGKDSQGPSEDALEGLYEDVQQELLSATKNTVGDILKSGRTVVYKNDDTPPGHVIRESPNGHRELVAVNIRAGTETVVQILS